MSSWQCIAPGGLPTAQCAEALVLRTHSPRVTRQIDRGCRLPEALKRKGWVVQPTGPGGRSSNIAALAACNANSSCSFSAMASAAPAHMRPSLSDTSVGSGHLVRWCRAAQAAPHLPRSCGASLLQVRLYHTPKAADPGSRNDAGVGWQAEDSAMFVEYCECTPQL